MIKAVLDTSVFVAALLSSKQDSVPVKVLNIWREGHFTLVMSPQLMRELVVKLRRKGVSAQNVRHYTKKRPHNGERFLFS